MSLYSERTRRRVVRAGGRAVSEDSGGGLYVNVDSVREWATVLARSAGLARSWRNLTSETDAFGTDPGLDSAWRLRSRNADALAAALGALEQVDAVFTSLGAAVAGSGADYSRTDTRAAADLARTAGLPAPAAPDGEAGQPGPAVDPDLVRPTGTPVRAGETPVDTDRGPHGTDRDYATLSFDRLRALVMRDNPEAMRALSDRWSGLGDSLYRQAETLGRAADGLARHWRSPGGQAVVNQVREHKRALEDAGNAAYHNRWALIGAAGALTDAQRAMQELEHQLPRTMPEAISRTLPLPDVLKGVPELDSRQPRAVAITGQLADAYDNHQARIADPQVAPSVAPHYTVDGSGAPSGPFAASSSEQWLRSSPVGDTVSSGGDGPVTGPVGIRTSGTGGGGSTGAGPVLAGGTSAPPVAAPPVAPPTPVLTTPAANGGAGFGPVPPIVGVAFPGRGGGVSPLDVRGTMRGATRPAPSGLSAPPPAGAVRGPVAPLPPGLGQPAVPPGTALQGQPTGTRESPGRPRRSSRATSGRSGGAGGPQVIGQRPGVNAYRNDEHPWRPRPRSAADPGMWDNGDEPLWRVIGARSPHVEDPNRVNDPHPPGASDGDLAPLEFLDTDGIRVTLPSDRHG